MRERISDFSAYHISRPYQSANYRENPFVCLFVVVVKGLLLILTTNIFKYSLTQLNVTNRQKLAEFVQYNRCKSTAG